MSATANLVGTMIVDSRFSEFSSDMCLPDNICFYGHALFVVEGIVSNCIYCTN